jgi:hypothetical protein
VDRTPETITEADIDGQFTRHLQRGQLLGSLALEPAPSTCVKNVAVGGEAA